MPARSLVEPFAELPDPRAHPAKRPPLINVLVIALCAMLCGAEDFVAMHAFGKSKFTWFAHRLDLSAGIPSHDTFGRVFAALDPEAFGDCFVGWVEALRTHWPHEGIACDGKRLRPSFDTATGQAALPLVSAWAQKARLVLGQMATEDKSNEITTVPALLALLDIQGCIVTVDARNPQKTLATQVVAPGGDYLFALKGNHPALLADVQALFEHAACSRFENRPHDTCQALDKGHGRIETRRCRAVGLSALGSLWEDVHAQWKGLARLVQIESVRQIGSQVTTETRSYLSSLPANAKRLLRAVRAHWGIENRLHWVLDVAFDEDACRVRTDHAAQNLATLGHSVLNLLRQDKHGKGGVKNRRLQAGWDDRYLEKLLTG